ncbi:hypothetical protein M407DRAFT_20525 [Tulasnella calospora MUT 4182]|uniref:Uncharacterized protein n=1 Tax=Tulasnella calospora MUT 4182 TaxID=1051891 RepID=A0A0C3M9U1_9AGAM|nr:hypothetical protein M407DRAFT_20525 [Tulasnella calospora MUT 4182]
MASVQTLQYQPQVGFEMGMGPGSTPVTLPFNSIRMTGRAKELMWKDNRSSTFWSDVILAEVEGKPLLAKVYTHAAGGEKAFIRDLETLKREERVTGPRVYGLSNDGATPCIIFSASSLTPFCDYISTLVAKSPDTALQRVWQLLIDMRNKGAHILANNSSIGSIAICDVIGKAHVDDQGNVVLTPEYGDCGAPYQGSMEDVVRFAWAAVLQRAYLRPLRPLGYALSGSAAAVLSKSPSEFGSLEAALDYLHQLWIAPASRYLNWPPGLRTGDFTPGDIGVFERTAERGLSFRKLESISQDLGGVDTTLDVSDFEQVGEKIFKATCEPFGKNSIKDFMLCWRNQLTDRAIELEWLRKNAVRIGSKHNVLPQDLVLLTETVHGLDAASVEALTKSTRNPIHFYVHMDQFGRARKRYWTLDDKPKSALELSKVTNGEDCDKTGLPLPHVDMHFGEEPFPTKYLQVEAVDVTPF